MRKYFKGFTLMELLLVMAIIMILSVIGIGAYMQATLKARDTQRKSDLGQIAKALELFNNDVGSYPNSDNGVMLCPILGGSTPPCGEDIKAYFNSATTTYMLSTPVDQSANRVYYYEQVPGGSFALYAALENTEDRDVVENSSGDKTNWGIECGSVTNLCNYKLTETGLIREK